VKLKVTGVKGTLPETPNIEKSRTQQVHGTMILVPMVSTDVSIEIYGSTLLLLHPILKPKQSICKRPAGKAKLSFEIMY
jgi:hypothetical protein